MASEKIFLTGGTGFLGSYLLRMLVSRGAEVTALKREHSKMDLVADVAHRVRWITGDILDVPVLEDAMEGIDQVYHAAAIVSFLPKDRQRMMKINVEGTANVVNVAMYRGVKKLGYVSSVAAIGRMADSKIISEKNKWENSGENTQYAISKYLAEQEVWRGTIEGLPAVMINPTIVVGAGFWNETSVKFFKQINDGLRFYTEGATGFVDVRDAARSLIQLMESDIQNQRYLLNGENMAYLQFFTEIAHALGKQPPSILASAFLRQLVWRMEWLRSKITGSNPFITKETAQTASHQYQYVNQKIVETLGYEFRPISETIAETALLFKKSQKEGSHFGVFPVL